MKIFSDKKISLRTSTLIIIIAFCLGLGVKTLVAAYAETSDFAKAVRTQKEAIALLQDEASKKDYTTRLEVYTTNTPYRARE